MIQYAATDIRSFLVDSWSKCHLKLCTFSCIANCKAVSVSHTQCVLDLWPFNVWKICLQWCSVMYCGFKCYLTLLNPTCSSIMDGNKSKDSVPVSFFSFPNYLILAVISCGPLILLHFLLLLLFYLTLHSVILNFLSVN